MRQILPGDPDVEVLCRRCNDAECSSRLDNSGHVTPEELYCVAVAGQ